MGEERIGNFTCAYCGASCCLTAENVIAHEGCKPRDPRDAEIARLTALLAEAAKVLEFYADKRKHIDSVVLLDDGAKARATIAKIGA